MTKEKDRLADYLTRRFADTGIEALKDLADYCGKTEVEKARLVRAITGESAEDHAYQMGRSYHNNGPDGINSDFSNFATREQTDAWERGFKDAKNKTPEA